MATNNVKNGGLRLANAVVDQPLMVCVHTASELLGIGDAVKTGGSSGQVAGGPYTKTVARCAAGDPIYGVVEGVLRYFVASGMNLDIRHAESGVSTYVLVRVANPYDVYAISEDGTLAVTDIGLLANLTGNGGGTSVTDCNTTSGLSTMLLDTSTAQTTDTLQLKMTAYEDTPDNNPGVLNSSILVTLNLIETGGVGGTAVNGL